MSTKFQLPNGLPILAYDVADFAKAMGIGKTKAYEMITSGEIKSGLLGGKRIIPIAEIERVLQKAIDDALTCESR